jgi:AcrR family transcriptional regulator
MDRKDELCAKALDYCLAHGLSDLSLRPLALEIGTSARLLIYHFGSRDGLISAVMDEAHRRVQKSFGDLMRSGGNRDLLGKFWHWTTAPDNSPYVRLLFELQMLALQRPAAYARYLKGTSSSWLALIETALPPSADRRARATLCAAVIDGLLLEFLSTGDLRRTSSALDVFGSMLSARTRSVGRARASARNGRLKGRQQSHE